MRVKLVTKEMERTIPRLYEQDGKGDEAVIHAKLFTPDSNWTWYILEMDPQTGRCFGLVKGLETELGYFSIPELRKVRGPYGLPVERDRHFRKTTLGELKARKAGTR